MSDSGGGKGRPYSRGGEGGDIVSESEGEVWEGMIVHR